MQNELITSKYVNICRKAQSSTAVAYHSLFGKARIISTELADLLESAKTGITINGAIDSMGEKNARELLELGFLQTPDVEHRDILVAKLKERKQLVVDGGLVGAIQLVTTNSCNFKCQYCFAYTFEDAVENRNGAGEKVKTTELARNSKLERDGKKVIPLAKASSAVTDRNPSGKMSFEVAKNAIDNAIETCRLNKRNTLAVSFFGGEPLLNRPLIVKVLNHYKNGQDFGLHIQYEIGTNGSLFDAEMIKLLKEYQVGITISIDYINYDSMEFRAGHGATKTKWPEVAAGIRQLTENGLKPTITSVLSKETWENWNYNLIDFLAENGITNLNVIVSFQFEFLRENGPEAVADKLLTAWDYGHSKGVLLSGYWYESFSMLFDEKVYKARSDYKTCPAIGRLLSIEPNGSVFSCKTTNQPLGRVDDWSGVLKSPSYENYAMRAYSNSSYCNGCQIEGFCSGSCAGALEEAKDIHTMDEGYCRYMKRIVSGLIERHIPDDTQADIGVL